MYIYIYIYKRRTHLATVIGSDTLANCPRKVVWIGVREDQFACVYIHWVGCLNISKVGKRKETGDTVLLVG